MFNPSISFNDEIRAEGKTSCGKSGSEKEAGVCKIQAIFNKNVFVPGESAWCRIICDNSDCDKDVLGFKFLLTRCVTDKEREFKSKLVKVKEQGECKAGEKTDRTFLIKIPLENELDAR